MGVVTFKKRGHSVDRDLFRYTLWESHCGQYAVCRSEYTGQADLSTVYRALVRDASRHRWDIVSRHRKRHPAEMACERDAADRQAVQRSVLTTA